MDQPQKAGPESQSVAEAPKRRRGAQPGNHNARKAKAETPQVAIERHDPPHVATPKRRGRPPKVKTPPDTQIDAIADGIPPQSAPPKRKRGAPKGNTNAAGAKKLAAAMAETPTKFEEAPPKSDDTKRKRGGQPGNRNSVGHGQGRPEAIELNDQTLNRIKLLAKIRSTQEEAAAHFDVCASTFLSFLQKHKKAMDIWTNGHMQFNSSLRSKQIEMANAGSVPMLIWLGKQFLGQKDKHEHSGDKDNPVHHEHRIVTTPREAADAYAELIRSAA